MMVLLVNTRHYTGGGDSIYAFSLARLLQRNGHHVSFFAMQDERNVPDPNADLFVSPIDFRAINSRRNLGTGLRVISRAIYSVEARQKFACLLDRVKPDLVHLQNIHAHITPSVIFEAKRRKIPVVWTLHDYKLVCPNSHYLIDRTGEICEACKGGRFWHASQRRCKKNSFLASGMASLEAYAHQFMNVRGKVDAFLCPSNFLRRKLIENGFREEHAHHLPLFVPDHDFESPTDDQGYMLFVGRLEPLKGIYPLLEAARNTPEITLLLAGRAEGPLQSQLPGLLPPNAKYVGFKSRAELSVLRRGARAIVLPSVSYENQPFSILEAFASGKPVIASGIGGMEELIGNDERGILVTPGNERDLGMALARAADQADEAHRMGRAALAYAREVHSAQKHYQGLMSIYGGVSRT